jgi:hypothetical protein
MKMEAVDCTGVAGTVEPRRPGTWSGPYYERSGGPKLMVVPFWDRLSCAVPGQRQALWNPCLHFSLHSIDSLSPNARNDLIISD